MSKDFIKNFSEMLQDKDIKKGIISLINEVTKINLNDIFVDNIEQFQGVAEYNFYLINLTGKTKEGYEKQLFVKGIMKGKIKESLFCICDLAYEKYFNNSEKNQLKKISILEQKNVNNINEVSVNLFEGNLSKEKVNIEIYFIEMSKIIEYSQNKKINLEGRSKYIDLNQKDILILGVKN